LLANAIKFAKADRPVTIEIGGQTSEFEHSYYVHDCGVGFDSRYAHKLFAPFQRLHNSRAYAGNGIGLALVQRIVRRHGGRVWAESELGNGATFFFTLPIEEQK
jgi:two-component system sensor kinase